ncbi:GtrA family protein [Streptomyces sp. NPDC008150]|uniref:GtrA family protein n=1 Tax=Streptomyces sp. NPDC008150 TaxID=3364816 RepID=UPI0036EC26AE
MSVNLAESPGRTAAAAAVPLPAAPRVPSSVRHGRHGRPVRRVVVEAARFAVVGGSGVLVNFLVFNLLLRGVGSPATAATVVAGCAAVATNYLGLRHFAYRDRDARTRRQIALFFVLSGLGVVLESALFLAGYHGLGLRGPVGSNAVKAASLVVASGFRFLVYRTWVFRHDARRAA